MLRGGGADADDLRDLSGLLGEQDKVQMSKSWQGRATATSSQQHTTTVLVTAGLEPWTSSTPTDHPRGMARNDSDDRSGPRSRDDMHSAAEAAEGRAPSTTNPGRVPTPYRA